MKHTKKRQRMIFSMYEMFVKTNQQPRQPLQNKKKKIKTCKKNVR